MTQLRVSIVLVTAALVFTACSGVHNGSTPGSSTSGTPGSSTGGTTPPPTTSSLLPDSAVMQMEALIKEKQARTPEQRKISSQLLYAKSRRFASSALRIKKDVMRDDSTQVQNLLEADDQGRVLCDVHGDLGGGLERRIEEVKGLIVTTSTLHKSVRAWLPLETLETLAAQPAVEKIRPAMPAKLRRADPPGGLPKFHLTREQQLANVQAALKAYAEHRALKLAKPAVTGATNGNATTNVGAVTSEGDVALTAARARKFYGTDGTGVKIGVLSDSDDFAEAAIASGDLPANEFTLPGQSGRPGTGEGTAMMEIIHDLAPGAQLFFATAFNSPESFAENIVTMRETYGVDIIVDDVGYFFESPYQDDIIAQAVNQVTADGAMYFSAAGNDGNYDDGTSGVWEGDFAPAGALATLPSGYTVHDFQFDTHVISNRVEVAGGPLYLHWSDPGTLDAPGATDDYDLFVLDEDLRNVLAASTDIQDGNDIAFEFIDATIPVNSRIVIAKKAGSANRASRVQLSGGELGISSYGATYGHPVAARALGIAAVDVAEAVNGVFTPGPITPVELFSSDGPRQLFYNPNGTRISGGVTFASGGGAGRSKPDLSGVDGVVTTLPGTSGLNPFFGTSAAAPHAAAVAGLIKAAVPTLSNDEIAQAMTSSAIDIEGKGFDRDSGYGIASAMAGLKMAGAKSQVFLDLGTVTVQSGTAGPLLPGSTGQLTAQLINNGGANATQVSGTLTTTNPLVTITRGTATYPNLAAGTSGVNALPYTFTVDPSVLCGSKLSFQESVKFTGRGASPALFSITAPTGATSSTTVVTNYTGGRVAIPDGNATGVDVPITLTNVGVISKLRFHIQGSTCTAAQGATTVGVDHSWVGDLTMQLTSPSGTTLTLMNRPGGINNSGNNFCQTILDDSATTSIQNIATAGAPWQGSFKPATPLSTFSGENANGTWVLHVTDSVTVDTGSVRSFSIDTNGFTCTP